MRLAFIQPHRQRPPSTSALDKAVCHIRLETHPFPLVHAPSLNPCSRLGGRGPKSQPPGIQHQTHEQQTLALHPNLLGPGPLHALVKFKITALREVGFEGLGGGRSNGRRPRQKWRQRNTRNTPRARVMIINNHANSVMF